MGQPAWGYERTRAGAWVIVEKSTRKRVGCYALFAKAARHMHQLVSSVPEPEGVQHILTALFAPQSVAKVATVPDQQLVTGWASVITNPDGTAHIDTQGDIIEEEVLVATAHEFMRKDRVAGDTHRRIEGVGDIVESLVITEALHKLLGLPKHVPCGWLITAKVEDPDVWQRIKDGRLQGFSIGGTAERVPRLAKDSPGASEAHQPGTKWVPPRKRVRLSSRAPRAQWKEC